VRTAWKSDVAASIPEPLRPRRARFGTFGAWTEFDRWRCEDHQENILDPTFFALCVSWRPPVLIASRVEAGESSSQCPSIPASFAKRPVAAGLALWEVSVRTRFVAGDATMSMLGRGLCS
jgi:hypothetical protein